MTRRRTTVVLVVAGVALAAALACVAPAVRGHGPLGAVLCPTTVTSYAQEPYPAQPLEGTVTLRAGEQRSVGGYGDPLPADTPPELTGDPSGVRVSSVVRTTEERCGRVISGYRFHVLTANRDVVLELLSKRPARVRVTPVAG